MSPPGFRGDFAVGPGFRGTFELLHTGFVKSINDSIGLGVGGDVFGLGNGTTVVWVPVVMQWNFWFSEQWSAFGEPGFGGYFGHESLFRPAFYAGGRFAFTDSVSLTLRVGYPNVSVGVSFFL